MEAEDGRRALDFPLSHESTFLNVCQSKFTRLCGRSLGVTPPSHCAMRIYGACHCGNIKFQLDWVPEPSEVPARACGCTFCQKHGGVWTSCPTGSLAVQVANPSNVSHYAFGTRTAAFHVCATCGAVPVVTSEIGGTIYAVVNVNTFEHMDSSLLRRTPASFEGEDEASRLARRVRGWIPRVQFRQPGDA